MQSLKFHETTFQLSILKIPSSSNLAFARNSFWESWDQRQTFWWRLSTSFQRSINIEIQVDCADAHKFRRPPSLTSSFDRKLSSHYQLFHSGRWIKKNKTRRDVEASEQRLCLSHDFAWNSLRFPIVFSEFLSDFRDSVRDDDANQAEDEPKNKLNQKSPKLWNTKYKAFKLRNPSVIFGWGCSVASITSSDSLRRACALLLRCH